MAFSVSLVDVNMGQRRADKMAPSSSLEEHQIVTGGLLSLLFLPALLSGRKLAYIFVL